MPIPNVLRNVGFSEKEILVYLASLELGPQPASIIAHKTKMNRSTAYVVLTDLLKKGFMSRYNKGDLQIYMSVSPDMIVEYMQRKQQDFQQYSKDLEEALPELKAMTNPLSVRPKVQYYDGEEGVKTVMNETFSARGSLHCYSSMDKWLSSSLSDYMKGYVHKRIYEKRIHLKMLMNQADATLDYVTREYPKTLTDVKWIPPGFKIFDNEINIYDDKVNIVSLRPNQYFGIIIESEQIANTQKSIFDLTWNSIDFLSASLKGGKQAPKASEKLKKKK